MLSLIVPTSSLFGRYVYVYVISNCPSFHASSKCVIQYEVSGDDVFSTTYSDNSDAHRHLENDPRAFQALFQYMRRGGSPVTRKQEMFRWTPAYKRCSIVNAVRGAHDNSTS